jgi:Methyltransferase domain
MSSTRHRSPDSIKAYTKLGLRVYDRLVMYLLLKHVWGCNPGDLVNHYREHVTFNHADIGVGTGYCLDRCGFDSPDPRLVLIDLQSNCLEFTARRLARYRPRTYVRDVLRPIRDIADAPFDSIALGGVIHCLAGDLNQKSRVFDTLSMLAKSGTKIFGYSLVSDDVPRRARSRAVHRLLNWLRVVDNANDRLSDLKHELSTRFVDCRVRPIGCMALFSAVVP